jgi:hypothetical protein
MDEQQINRLALLFICPVCLADQGIDCDGGEVHVERSAPVAVVAQVAVAWAHRRASA